MFFQSSLGLKQYFYDLFLYIRKKLYCGPWVHPGFNIQGKYENMCAVSGEWVWQKTEQVQNASSPSFLSLTASH